jgi:hypothetical protein
LQDLSGLFAFSIFNESRNEEGAVAFQLRNRHANASSGLWRTEDVLRWCRSEDGSNLTGSASVFVERHSQTVLNTSMALAYDSSAVWLEVLDPEGAATAALLWPQRQPLQLDVQLHSQRLGIDLLAQLHCNGSQLEKLTCASAMRFADETHSMVTHGNLTRNERVLTLRMAAVSNFLEIGQWSKNFSDVPSMMRAVSRIRTNTSTG